MFMYEMTMVHLHKKSIHSFSSHFINIKIVVGELNRNRNSEPSVDFFHKIEASFSVSQVSFNYIQFTRLIITEIDSRISKIVLVYEQFRRTDRSQAASRNTRRMHAMLWICGVKRLPLQFVYIPYSICIGIVKQVLNRQLKTQNIRSQGSKPETLENTVTFSCQNSMELLY